MKALYLITTSGSDRPGVTASLNELLSDYDAGILDIGQAVIHNALSLGILTAISDNLIGAKIEKAIAELAVRLNVHISIEPITSEEYEAWVERQGQPGYIVTVLGRRIGAEHIARITRKVAEHGLNIDKINRLSGRTSLLADINETKACVEFSLRGNPNDHKQLTESFLTMASEMNIDIAFQEDSIYRRYRRLVVFDMDSTLIDVEVIDELAKEYGVGDQVSLITEQAMRGEIDFRESFQRRVALLAGLSEETLEKVASRINLTEGAELLISTMRSLGYTTAILSGGFTYFAELLRERLGIDYIHANMLEINDGKVTGKVVGDVIDGARKAELLQHIATQEGIALEQVIAVGDGANDLPMLSIAGLGIAFNAKPIVRQTAKQAISNIGLDGILYLIGCRDRDRLK